MVTAIVIVAACAVVAAALVFFAVAPSRGCKEMRKAFFHRNLAHRGLHTKNKSVPENSMAAFAAAADAGYGIELDLQFSKDEQIVVFHDDTLKRVCKVSGRVDDYTYEELKNFGLSGTDEHIPLFSEVLELVDGRVPMLVEFKNGPKNNLLCEKTLPMLRAYKGEFCIESFSPLIVGWFKKNAPDILRGQLASPVEGYEGSGVKPFTAWLLSHCMLNFISRPHFIAYRKDKTYKLVKLADRLGAMRFVWTARPSDDVAGLEKINDSMIFEYYTPGVKY